MNITKDIYYVGVNDHEIDLFEGQFIVPNGMAYNSYVILDEQVAVMDSVDARFTDLWLQNIHDVLGERSPDYLVVHHMEPDHSGSVARFAEHYPDAKIVASARAFTMMKQFFGTDFQERQVVVGEGTTLSLGSHELAFVAAPMVHWPEVVVSFDTKDKVLFSADAFGKFGALDAQEDWACEARRYYMGIVAKYGAPVQTLLKKAGNLPISIICPLHGPVLKENLSYYLDLYQVWSSYMPEEDAILIAYTSVYGNTKKAALLLAEKLRACGACKVTVTDLARDDMAEAVEDAFRYSKLVLATTTYNGEIFPFMGEFIRHLTERGYQNRTVAFVENGSWAPNATKTMKSLLAKSKDLRYATTEVKILSALSEESTDQLDELAKELTSESPCTACSVENHSEKGFVCKICGYVYQGECLPEDYVCPLCKHGAADFESVL